MAVKGYEYLCYNCMEPLNAPGEKCPECHCDNRQRSGSKGVLPACLLKDQYFVGRKLGDGGFGVTYIGYDLNLEQKVAIKEYFPRGIVLRDDDGISVRLFDASDETDYRRGRQRTLEEAQFIAKKAIFRTWCVFTMRFRPTELSTSSWNTSTGKR